MLFRSVPASWIHREGTRPNIIQVFQSDVGHGLLSCSIMVTTLPFPEGQIPTQEEVRDFLQPDGMKEMIPDGGVYVSAKPLVLDGVPAGMLVFDLALERLDFKIATRNTTFFVIESNSMISVQFVLSDSFVDDEAIQRLHERHLPIMMGIAGTFVLYGRWE